MSIVENLNRIKSCKESIKQAIINKGVDMEGVAFEGYADKISQISGGGNNTIDYVDISNWLGGSVNVSSATLIFGEPSLYNDESIQTIVGEGRYLSLEICTGVPEEIWTGEYTASVNEGFGSQGEFVRGYGSEIWGVEGQDWGTCWMTVSNGMTTAERVYDGTVKIIVDGDNLIVKIESSVVNAKAVCPISSIPFTVINTGYVDDSDTPSGTPTDYLQLRETMTEYSNADVYGFAEYAFAGCPNLSTVDLPNVSVVPNGAFMNCSNLASVNIPNSNVVGFNAFQYCGALTEINLPVCYNVGDNAFLGTSLTAIDLPEVSDIGQNAFNSLFNLTTVNIPKCKRLGYGAFQGTSITAVDLPICENVGDYSFAYCNNITSANLPVCVNIGGSAFEGNAALTTVYAPTCTNIGWNAFNNTSLSDLDISKIYWCNLSSPDIFNETPLRNGEGTIKVHKSSLAKYQSDFAWSAFADRFVGVGEDDEVLLAFDNGRMYGDTTILGMTYANYLGIDAMNSLTEIDLPNCSMFETDQWGNGVNFAWFGQLQTVKLPSMTVIGNNTFSMCQSLTTVDIANCTNIGSNAFQDCGGLTSINLPKCSSISASAFENCSNLKTITVGTGLEDGYMCFIDPTTFNNCTSIEAIYVPASQVDAYKTTGGWDMYADKIFAAE